MEATERKVGQRVMLNLLAAGLATATLILTCFIDIYPNNPRSIDQKTLEKDHLSDLLPDI